MTKVNNVRFRIKGGKMQRRNFVLNSTVPANGLSAANKREMRKILATTRGMSCSESDVQFEDEVRKQAEDEEAARVRAEKKAEEEAAKRNAGQ